MTWAHLSEVLRSHDLAHEVTARYYRERALPQLIPFPARRAPQVTEPIAEGYMDWGAGDWEQKGRDDEERG